MLYSSMLQIRNMSIQTKESKVVENDEGERERARVRVRV